MMIISKEDFKIVKNKIQFNKNISGFVVLYIKDDKNCKKLMKKLEVINTKILYFDVMLDNNTHYKTIETQYKFVPRILYLNCGDVYNDNIRLVDILNMRTKF